jgi:hypothetical protein
MAVRIRKSGKIVCAAMFPEEDGDLYIKDSLHYYLSVEMKILVTEPHENHSVHGEWWWKLAVPPSVNIDDFYK